MKQDARFLSVKILNRFDKKNEQLVLSRNQIFSSFKPESIDKSRAMVLTNEIIRLRDRLDVMIEYVSGRKTNRLDPSLISILRVGFYEIIYDESIPDYAAVDSLVNLTKTLLIDVHFLKIWLGKEAFQSSVSLVTNKQDLTQCMSDKDNKIIVIEAKNQELIKDCGIDLFINIASMQEMNPKIINQYFNDLKNSNNKPYFYCCNREKKTLPDGTIVKFSDYPWGDASIVLDELCPWYLDFYNKTPPFFHNYDGLIRHRIVRFGE